MLITAESGAWISDLAASMGVEMHAKPIAPEMIERFLSQVGAAWSLPALAPAAGASASSSMGEV